MGYMVEVSFDTRRRSDVTALQSSLRATAISFGGDAGFFVHELEGRGRTMVEQNCVYTTEFESGDDEDDDSVIKKCKQFLQKVSRLDRVYVETVSNTHGYTMIYASHKYLKRMGKDVKKTYNLSRKDLSINELEKDMLAAIKRNK
jgi:hypothetical protein